MAKSNQKENGMNTQLYVGGAPVAAITSRQLQTLEEGEAVVLQFRGYNGNDTATIQQNGTGIQLTTNMHGTREVNDINRIIR